MLENIRSKYVLKYSLSFIIEKKKLYLVRYNKNIQSKLNINLLNYKIFSGICTTIYEDNKNIKIYDAYSDNLIFEGEFSNGHKNGKGKEYGNRGLLIFEGEYINGTRNGKGKEYFDNGKLKFEGEYHYGLRNGKGKEYFKNGELKFEGEYRCGKMYEGKMFDIKLKKIIELNKGKGIIKEYNDYCEHIIYEGEYLNGERHGKGKEYYENGRIKFEGEYLNGKRWNGIGYNTRNNKVFELLNGYGLVKEYYDNNKIKFEGEYLNGERHGKGKEYYENGRIKFEGEYISGRKNGNCKFYNENLSLEFEGEYLDDKRYGEGKEYDLKGELIFEGEYIYNYKIRGKDYYIGKLEYEGEYLYNRKYNGKGFDSKGNIIYELNNGNGKVKEYYKNKIK